MGVDRALSVVALQALLMSGVREYRDQAAVAAHTHDLLATAASLDYVLMLATDTAGTPFAEAEAQQAIRAGFARAIDSALVLLRAISDLHGPAARVFAREGLSTVRSAIEDEGLADNDRAFALIALTTDLCS